MAVEPIPLLDNRKGRYIQNCTNLRRFRHGNLGSPVERDGHRGRSQEGNQQPGETR